MSQLPPKTPQSLTWSDRLTRFINQIHIAPETLLLLSACLIGGGTGIAIALLRTLIGVIHWTGIHSLWVVSSQHSFWWIPLLPGVGGLLVGVLRWQQPNILGQSLQRLLTDDREQITSPLRPLYKLIAAATSIGTGASLGTEGPSVEIGATIGALLGQTFQVSKDRYRLLLGAGAAAGLAAGFNAPIAGVFLALELILPQSFTTQGASLLLLSAVISALIARAIFGIEAEFDLPTYQVLSRWEWICYLGLGVLASGVSILYGQAIQFFQALFQGKIIQIPGLTLPSPWTPIIGGLGVGAIALVLPQIMGVGYGTIDDILQQTHLSIPLLSALLLGKIIATALSLGSGFVGGIFAPALFLGACLGSLYGIVLSSLAPPAIATGIAPPAAYAMVGMAAVLAGSTKAPLTSILLLFELTRNYLIILPLMAAVGVSIWLVEQIQSLPWLNQLSLFQMGIGVQTTNRAELLQSVTVAEFMETDYLTLSPSLSLPEAAQRLLEAKTNIAILTNEMQQLIGVVSLTDIQRHLNSLVEFCPIVPPTLASFSSNEVVCAFLEEPLSQALERMETRGLMSLPVVTPENPRQVLGLLKQTQSSLAVDWVKVRSLLEAS